eukprot:g2657.t1
MQALVAAHHESKAAGGAGAPAAAASGGASGASGAAPSSASSASSAPSAPSAAAAAATSAAVDKAKDELRSKADDTFFHYYGLLSHQQNMLQDYVRTGHYNSGILHNAADFRDKVVLDVGTGTGILAIFAAQAGARKVYGIEASSIAPHAERLIEANGLSDRIEIVRGKVQDVQLPEKVDVIVSEPMGFMLVHERMLEVFVMARDKWLKPGGRMFPTRGTIYLAPFTDQSLYDEVEQKVVFWEQSDFYGVDVSCMKAAARKEAFAQPVVGYFDPKILLSSATVTHTIDFTTITVEGFHKIHIPYSFEIDKPALLHGIASWFDVVFEGSEATIPLTTAPGAPDTHWYQCRLLLEAPLGVNATQRISGELHMTANTQSSYDVDMSMALDGTRIHAKTDIALHNQFYHYWGKAAAGTVATEGGDAAGH